jgi:CBS domain containing-hemolysin-like protein
VRLPGRYYREDCEDWVDAEWEGTEDTVSGFITRHLGHLPEPGERLCIEGVEVLVEGVANHVITSVIATPKPPEEESP